MTDEKAVSKPGSTAQYKFMGHTGKAEELREKDPLYALRHSAAHIMAAAVRRLYPEAKLAIGPPIEDGFYYDLDLPVKLTDEDLPKIEAEMEKIIQDNQSFRQSFMNKEEAIKYFREKGERYKLEIIQGISDGQVSIFTNGEFVDLCEGPHVPTTADVKAIKLLGLAGAYWRGDEHNPQLQRIYGTAYSKKADLDAHLNRLEEARKRDHRRLGKELELFSFEDLAGPGVVFYHPKGALVRSLIEDDMRRRHLDNGYSFVVTPHLFRTDLWQRSGHLDYYRENMFVFETDEQSFGIKPMNCPGHILIYKSKLRSYRDLPLRFFELGTVYRNEKSGVMHGLMRVRGFTQDDAHLFLREDQLVDEVGRVIDFEFEILKTFGFTDYEIDLSTRPDKAIGSDEMWEKAEAALRQALELRRLKFAVHAGEGAFYGPKIDIKIKDAIGRSWQCGTIQCDFALPERFDLTYVGEDGRQHRTIMVHRALLGSMERFFGVLLEHYAGALPLWLSPVQVTVVPVGEAAQSYAAEVESRLRTARLRVNLDDRNERMQAKIRDAQMAQVPYMAVVGGREAQAKTVAVRHRRLGDLGVMPLDTFIQKLLGEQTQKLTGPSLNKEG